MTGSAIETALAHHAWATGRIVAACQSLTRAQLETTVPGTYGSILATLRHLVESDCFELSVANPGCEYVDKIEAMGLVELGVVAQRSAAGWAELLASNPDPATIVREVDPGDGFQRDAPLGLRLVQVLHHANEHRTQICTALTSLGVTPPALGAYTFGEELGEVLEVYPSTE